MAQRKGYRIEKSSLAVRLPLIITRLPGHELKTTTTHKPLLCGMSESVDSYPAKVLETDETEE